MRERIENFNIDSKCIEELATKLSKNKEIKNIDIDYKQFIVDVVTRNYKLKKKNIGILMGSIAMIMVPIESLAVVFFGRLGMLINLATGILDEAYFTMKIIAVIIDEKKSYTKFRQSKGYKAAELNTDYKLDIDPRYVLSQIKEFTEDKKNRVNISRDDSNYALNIWYENLSLADIIKYETNDYKLAAIEYVTNNSKSDKEKFIKIDPSKVKKNALVKTAFDEVEFQKVVQTHMKLELESSSKKLGTYRLTGIVETAANQPAYTTKVIGTTKIYMIENHVLNINLLNQIITEINNIEECIQNIIFKLNNLVIKISVIDNFKVQVISDDVKYIGAAEELQNELSMQLKANRNIIVPNVTVNESEFSVSDELVEYQVRLALRKISALMLNQETVVFSLDMFLKFIPMYKKEDKIRYLICAQDNFDTVTVNGSKIIVQVEQDYDFKAEIDRFSINQKYNYLLLCTEINGNLDIEHAIKIMHKLFLIQLYSTDSDLIKLVVNINCSNGVIIQAKQYDKYEVSVVDPTAKLGNNIELRLEAMLKEEIKSNMKLFKTYNKSNIKYLN